MLGTRLSKIRVPGEPVVNILSKTRLVGAPLGSMRPTPPAPDETLDECDEYTWYQCRYPD